MLKIYNKFTLIIIISLNYNNKNKEAFIKQSYDPGQRAEYDFHQIKVLIDGKLNLPLQPFIKI